MDIFCKTNHVKKLFQRNILLHRMLSSQSVSDICVGWLSVSSNIMLHLDSTIFFFFFQLISRLHKGTQKCRIQEKTNTSFIKIFCY